MSSGGGGAGRRNKYKRIHRKVLVNTLQREDADGLYNHEPMTSQQQLVCWLFNPTSMYSRIKINQYIRSVPSTFRTQFLKIMRRIIKWDDDASGGI